MVTVHKWVHGWKLLGSLAPVERLICRQIIVDDVVADCVVVGSFTHFLLL